MSKSLEALKRLKQETCPATYMQDFDKDKCIEIIRKELEVLEILKNKEVDIHVVNKSEDYITYNTMLKYRYYCSCDKGLREDEYNKIKEWLEK